MMRAILAGLAATCATTAFAQGTATPSSGWQAYPIEDGCSIVRMIEGEGSPAVQLMLGHGGASTIVFFVPGSKIEPGRFYTGIIAWDDRNFPVHFFAGGTPEMPGVALQDAGDNLVGAVAASDSVFVKVLGVTGAMEFPLPGAKEAVANLRKCVAETKPK